MRFSFRTVIAAPNHEFPSCRFLLNSVGVKSADGSAVAPSRISTKSSRAGAREKPGQGSGKWRAAAQRFSAVCVTQANN